MTLLLIYPGLHRVILQFCPINIKFRKKCKILRPFQCHVFDIPGFRKHFQNIFLAGIGFGIETERPLVYKFNSVHAGQDLKFGLAIVISLAPETFNTSYFDRLFHIDYKVVRIGRLGEVPG